MKTQTIHRQWSRKSSPATAPKSRYEAWKIEKDHKLDDLLTIFFAQIREVIQERREKEGN